MVSKQGRVRNSEVSHFDEHADIQDSSQNTTETV